MTDEAETIMAVAITLVCVGLALLSERHQRRHRKAREEMEAASGKRLREMSEAIDKRLGLR